LRSNSSASALAAQTLAEIGAAEIMPPLRVEAPTPKSPRSRTTRRHRCGAAPAPSTGRHNQPDRHRSGRWILGEGVVGRQASHHQGAALKSGWKMSERIRSRSPSVELPVAITRRLGAGRTAIPRLLGFSGRTGGTGSAVAALEDSRFLDVGHGRMMPVRVLIRHSLDHLSRHELLSPALLWRLTGFFLVVGYLWAASRSRPGAGGGAGHEPRLLEQRQDGAAHEQRAGGRPQQARLMASCRAWPSAPACPCRAST
jgi:hypothetical protein